MNNYLIIHENDNVLIALHDFSKGNKINIGDEIFTFEEDIKRAHKVARININKGENIIKYGRPIGYATVDIKKGQHVHTHNIKTNLNDIISYFYKPHFEQVKTHLGARTIKAYRRFNDEIGIRNELWIIPTVGCVNGTVDGIVDAFKRRNDLSSIDGVFGFKHPYGCSQMGDDHVHTRKTLQNIVKHPNAGGVLVLGLGCENNQVDIFKETLGEYNKDRVKFLIAQEVEDEIEEGVKILEELFEKMVGDNREDFPIGKLKIGLECGGSDGLSGITANPLLGVFSDYLITHSGTTVLTEVPEMFGAETILMDRCINKKVYHKTVDMINEFKAYYKNHGQVIYENPSPGNKNGGITTLEDKSLGCIQKSGSSQVVDVLKLGDRLHKQGLNLLSAPGNDAVATTALGIAGCHMVLFTTGRGTPFGGFIPTMKLSTNTPLAKKKSNWIDFDAGRLVGERSMDELLEEFVDYLVDVVNGKYVNQEKNNFREIAIFKSGVTL